MEIVQFQKSELINAFLKSKHGKLEEYVQVGLSASKYEPEFFSHLIAWNLIKGEIRDSKIALPILALRQFGNTINEFSENAVASLMLLDPRSLVKAYNFNKELVKIGLNISGGQRKKLQEGIQRYLQVRESNNGWWVKTAVQHRNDLKTLYAVSHYHPSDFAQQVLFERDYPKGSVFEKIHSLKNMSDSEAAGTILNFKIPFQIALGSLGRKKSDFQENPEFILALLEGMSGQQLINSTKFLESLDVFKNPMLKSEYNKALERAKNDKKVTTLKANKAMESMSESSDVNQDILRKLSEIQEVKINEKGIEGDWAILGDCSGSMKKAIEISKEIASYLTKSVKGKVYLIYFNTEPRVFDVTGKKLEEIKVLTQYIGAHGGTSCGCGLKYLQDRKIVVNGIAMVSDGGDNTHPLFHDAYKEYCRKMDIEPTVYLFHVNGERNVLSDYCKINKIQIETHDMEGSDYYSLPNIIPTLKTTRYSLIDEIMNIPLLTFEKVFQNNQRKEK